MRNHLQISETDCGGQNDSATRPSKSAPFWGLCQRLAQGRIVCIILFFRLCEPFKADRLTMLVSKHKIRVTVLSWFTWECPCLPETFYILESRIPCSWNILRNHPTWGPPYLKFNIRESVETHWLPNGRHLKEDRWHFQVHIVKIGGILQIRCNNMDSANSIMNNKQKHWIKSISFLDF